MYLNLDLISALPHELNLQVLFIKKLIKNGKKKTLDTKKFYTMKQWNFAQYLWKL